MPPAAVIVAEPVGEVQVAWTMSLAVAVKVELACLISKLTSKVQPTLSLTVTL